MQVVVLLCSIVSNSWQPRGLWPAGLLCLWDFPSKNTGVGCHFLAPGDLPNPGIEPTSPSLAGRLFTAEPSGKPALGITGTQVPGG